jgi:hypothetical protein
VRPVLQLDPTLLPPPRYGRSRCFETMPSGPQSSCSTGDLAVSKVQRRCCPAASRRSQLLEDRSSRRVNSAMLRPCPTSRLRYMGSRSLRSLKQTSFWLDRSRSKSEYLDHLARSTSPPRVLVKFGMLPRAIDLAAVHRRVRLHNLPSLPRLRMHHQCE